MKAEILAEHYQKTFELTLTLWEQRNRTFLILLFVIGLGTFLTFNVNQAEPLLVDFIAKIFNVEDKTRLDELRGSFPYGLIQSVILMVVLYLFVQLYHRTITITRNYRYLGSMEAEIRAFLELDQEKVSFTRESTFYWEQSPRFSKYIGVAYIVIIGLLLFAFLIMRIYSDFKSGNFFATIIDLILALITIFFYFNYAYSSSSFLRYLINEVRGKT